MITPGQQQLYHLELQVKQSCSVHWSGWKQTSKGLLFASSDSNCANSNPASQQRLWGGSTWPTFVSSPGLSLLVLLMLKLTVCYRTSTFISHTHAHTHTRDQHFRHKHTNITAGCWKKWWEDQSSVARAANRVWEQHIKYSSPINVPVRREMLVIDQI